MTKHYTMGHNSYGNPTVTHYHPGKQCHCHIGNYTSIGNKVTIIIAGEHNTHSITTHPLFNVLPIKEAPTNSTPCNVTIGNDVWIGYGATILSPCVIGDGAIIGANTTITKDIPPYAVVVGNPPKIIKYRFNKSDRIRLQQIAWWNLTDEQVTEIAPNLYSDNIDELERIVNGM